MQMKMGADADGCRGRWVQTDGCICRWVQMQMGADADGCRCRWVHICRWVQMQMGADADGCRGRWVQADGCRCDGASEGTGKGAGAQPGARTQCCGHTGACMPPASYNDLLLPVGPPRLLRRPGVEKWLTREKTPHPQTMLID